MALFDLTLKISSIGLIIMLKKGIMLCGADPLMCVMATEVCLLLDVYYYYYYYHLSFIKYMRVSVLKK